MCLGSARHESSCASTSCSWPQGTESASCASSVCTRTSRPMTSPRRSPTTSFESLSGSVKQGKVSALPTRTTLRYHTRANMLSNVPSLPSAEYLFDGACTYAKELKRVFLRPTTSQVETSSSKDNCYKGYILACIPFRNRLSVRLD